MEKQSKSKGPILLTAPLNLYEERKHLHPYRYMTST